MGKKLRERKGITLCSVRSLSPVQGPRPRSSQSMRGRFIRPKGHRTVSDFPQSSRFPRCLCHRSWCSSACLPEWRQPGWARAASKGLHLHSAQAVPGRREMPPQACFLPPSPPPLRSVKLNRETVLSSISRQPHKACYPHPALCTRLSAWPWPSRPRQVVVTTSPRKECCGGC